MTKDEANAVGQLMGAAKIAEATIYDLRAQLAESEREVAALRGRATKAEGELDMLRKIYRARNDELMAANTKHAQRIADLEAERAALMEAGKVLSSAYSLGNETFQMARAVFDEVPGALAAWMAREER